MKNLSFFDILPSLNPEQLESLKNIESTFSNIQCAWLSGYFWKLAVEKSIDDTIVHKKELHRDQIITIISASQTGNAKLLSHKLNHYLKKNNKKTNLINVSDYKFKKINNEQILILIISTQGEGEPPEEAFSFYQYILSKKAPKLDNLYYSIFALGDTSYNLFCQSGKDFDARFKELGGKSLLDRMDVDIDYEDDYEKWSKKLLKAINHINIDIKRSSMSINNTSTPSIYTKKNPATAIVLSNQKITGRYSTKDIHHIEIDISGLNINYIPGDALGVWYQNDINLVKKILALCSINVTDKVMLKNNNITIFDALKYHFELTNNTKNIIKNYSNITKNKCLQKIVSKEDSLQYYSDHTPLVNMMIDYPSKLSSQKLISLLRPLTPRLYSISSSQNEVDNEVHITVGVVKKLISDYVHLGGASGYLSNFLKPDDKVKIFIEENNNFRLPSNQDTSIIMISSGTGIAPFRAFIQERDSNGSKGKNWLFFGNPNFTEDFLYQIEWQKYIKNGLINNISLAWSQDQDHKIYVQDKIRENGKEIWSWIKDGAQIYVCGNASTMAKDVERALLDIISKNGSMSLKSSHEFLNNLRMTQRYQRDVY